MKYPDADAQARIRMNLTEILDELGVKADELESMTVEPDQLTFVLSVRMPVAPIGP